MTENPYSCLECGGTGEMSCPCCDQETECDVCRGNGLNAELLNVDAFLQAEAQLQAGSRYTCAWIEDGVWLGRKSSDGRTLAYKDFAKKVM